MRGLFGCARRRQRRWGGAGYVTGRLWGLAARIARRPAPGRKKNLASRVRAAKKAILSGHVIFGYVSCSCVVWLWAHFLQTPYKKWPFWEKSIRGGGAGTAAPQSTSEDLWEGQGKSERKSRVRITVPYLKEFRWCSTRVACRLPERLVTRSA